MKLLLFALLAVVLVFATRRLLTARPQTTSAPPPSSTMSRKTAADLLGLAEDADRDAIVAAHRRLMQKVHPDHGGSTALAQQLNEAKHVLLKKR